MINSGYDAFYAFSKTRTGYSGVVTFVKEHIPTLDAQNHLEHPAWSSVELKELNAEGRSILTHHDSFAVLNVYCPAYRNEERSKYKYRYHQLLQAQLNQSAVPILLVGDLNIVHRRIDHCDPDEETKRYSKDDSARFEDSIYREWMDALLDADGPWIDCFRLKHPTQTGAYTFWNNVTSARETNYGKRIDYIIGSKELVQQFLVECRLRPDVYGSDHCPVEAEFSFTPLPLSSSYRVADLCTKNLPEFRGKQKSIKSFLQEKHTIDLTQDRRMTSTTRQLTMKSFMSNATGSKKRSVAATKTVDRQFYSITNPETASQWKAILPGKPPEAPVCTAHQLPAVLRKVLNPTSKNWGRKFYVCSLPEGSASDPKARCSYFAWADHKGRLDAGTFKKRQKSEN